MSQDRANPSREQQASTEVRPASPRSSSASRQSACSSLSPPPPPPPTRSRNLEAPLMSTSASSLGTHHQHFVAAAAAAAANIKISAQANASHYPISSTPNMGHYQQQQQQQQQPLHLKQYHGAHNHLQQDLLAQSQLDNQHFQQANNCAGFNSLATAAAAVVRHNLDYNSIVHNQHQLQAQQLQQQLQQQQHWNQNLASLHQRRSYTGVDKLLLAAMVEESASSNADGSAIATTAASTTSITTAAIQSPAVTNTTPTTTARAAATQSQNSHPQPVVPATGAHFYPVQLMHHNQQQQQQQQLQMPYIPIGRGIGNSYSSNSMLTTRDTMMQIPTPRNKSELELYKLLERANLLHYFGTFLNFGGDDVQQLSDADEDEFLEIMSLIGMTKKPLHVRRFQKALIEWRENREAAREIFDPSPIGGSSSSFRRPNSLAHTRSSSANSMMHSLTDESLSSDQQQHHPGHGYVRMLIQ